MPGGDVNPYLATAAVIAAGLHGIEEELELEPAFEGNAYDDPDAEHVPTTLREAAGPLAGQRVRAHCVRRRRGRPLRQHGRRRARRLRRGGHRLGADPGVRAAVSDCERPSTSSIPATEEVVTTVQLADVARDRRRRRPGAPGLPSPGGRWRRATGRGCCAGSPSGSTPHLEDLAQLEVANSGHTIGNARWEAGNVRDVLTYYARRRSGCSAGRSRSPAASTSPSTSRSASSA